MGVTGNEGGADRGNVPTRAPRIGPDKRTLILGAALALLSFTALAIVVPHLGAVGEQPRLAWWGFAIAFAITEALAFNLEVKGEAHGFTLNNVPLVVGLFYVSPRGLVAAYLLGSAVTLVLRDRQRLVKLTFNLALTASEATVAIVVFRLLLGGASIVDPRSWVAAVIAVVVAGAVSSAAISLAMRWHGARPRLGLVLVAATVTSLCNTSLALTTALLVRQTLAASVLIGALALVLALAYRSYTSLWKRYANLQLFYDFTKAIGGSQRAESVLESILEQARELLRADVAELTLESPDPGGPVFALRAQGDMPFETSVPAQLLPSEWMRARVIEEDKVALVPRSFVAASAS